jgi:pilus assembly protein CpaC
MSGETANFLAGGEFPIPIPQGNGTISIEFKNYGVSLAFTPTLIGDNRISLHVKPEVSELTTQGSIILNNITVPAITTRRAETTVEVATGQSFAIAGLLDNTQTQTINKYPLLGDMPILGTLFRDDRFQNGQTELVIIITPYIVTPSGQRMSLPTDGFAIPSEADRLLSLRYSNSDPNARPISGETTAVQDLPHVSATSSDMPVPDAAPVAPVTSSNIVSSGLVMSEPAAPAPAAPTPTPAVPDPAAIKNDVHLDPIKATPVNLSPDSHPPSGPNGFILE